MTADQLPAYTIHQWDELIAALAAYHELAQSQAGYVGQLLLNDRYEDLMTLIGAAREAATAEAMQRARADQLDMFEGAPI